MIEIKRRDLSGIIKLEEKSVSGCERVRMGLGLFAAPGDRGTRRVRICASHKSAVYVRIESLLHASGQSSADRTPARLVSQRNSFNLN
jgi:hypothetical protein